MTVDNRPTFNRGFCQPTDRDQFQGNLKAIDDELRRLDAPMSEQKLVPPPQWQGGPNDRQTDK